MRLTALLVIRSSVSLHDQIIETSYYKTYNRQKACSNRADKHDRMLRNKGSLALCDSDQRVEVQNRNAEKENVADQVKTAQETLSCLLRGNEDSVPHGCQRVEKGDLSTGRNS